MKILKPTIYMIYGQYGSGKTNVLFKLCFNKVKEKDSGNKIVLISANYCTLGQNNICEKFCEITKIHFESEFQDNLTGFNYKSDTTYFMDFGSSLKDQKYIFEFFNSGNFNFNPILTIPAFMDFYIAESVLSQFSFITKPKILLTFCDYVSKTRINDFEFYLKKQNACIIGLNNSSNLSRGFILK
ncbi:MAG: hypothetical protein MR937_05195 [Spirochaetia bacterium]|uniref:hypothetical protein n=1 Tax=Treponema sp. TaxID=166 RepID=UPI00257C4FE7|nr:hypothetical protein [Treponema sp.]MCI6826695.1 hypothetical protein [Spirochaetia bacterium]